MWKLKYVVVRICIIYRERKIERDLYVLKKLCVVIEDEVE